MTMRIDKLLSNMGYGSRKQVKGFLKEGAVLLNDEVVTTGKARVNPDKDTVTIFGEKVHYRKYIYLMMNKPDGFLSATEDWYDPTVIDLLPEEYIHFEPFPIGRLDKDTEGLLLISNDGKLAHELTSPKKEIGKTYFARINGLVTEDDVVAFKQGVTLDDGYKTKPGNLKICTSDNVSTIELTITEGKYHQVKRMFEAVDKEVLYLKRIRMGNIGLDYELELGEVRELTDEELAYCLALKS